jgi:hypothetical protein
MKHISLWNIPRLGTLCLLFFQGLETQAAGGLQGARGVLTVDAQGISLAPASATCPTITARGEPMWAVLMQSDTPPPVAGAPVVLGDKGQQPQREVTADGIRLTYASLTDGKRTWRVGVTLDFHRKGDAFEVTGEVRNDEPGWLMCGFTGPVLHGIRADLATHPALLPDGLGRIIHRMPDDKKGSNEVGVVYPSRKGTMQWCTLSGAQGGLYFGCHDATHGAKTICVRRDAASQTYGLAVKHQAFCAVGQRWALPPTVIMPYAGSWHTAARYYRAWSESIEPPLAVPEWARNASGWLLCILKQQNGEVHWDYSSLGKLCDVADARGLDILGLFGWAHGGHDHLYPEYFSDPKMGGEEALRKALRDIRQRGKRSILYANGQLIEQGTEFWSKEGQALAVLKKDGTPVQQTYHKYRTTAPFRFGLGCLVAPAWFDRMLALAVQAHALGADGILYDQLGVNEPLACYAAGHGHPVPVMVYVEDRVRFLRRIEEHMRKLNPDFIVMTEGLHDSVLGSISMFHGCMTGTFAVSGKEMLARLHRQDQSAPFPELFRYTFPAMLTTIRMPTPMLDRAMANFTCAYGLRFEIEARYAPDRRYLCEGHVPEAADYAEVINKPDIALMKATPPAAATRYLKQVIEFQRAHADLFWRGRFTDDEGFTFTGRDLVAKSFAAGNRLGVLVWNPGDQPATFALNVPGATLLAASEPERGKVEALGPLPPQSIRLLEWQRKE